MAAPKSSASKKRKTKEPISGSSSSSFNEYKFLSVFNQNQFYGWVSERKIIPEVGFQLGRNEYLEINIEINNRGWAILCNPPRKVVESLVREFYANAVPQPGQPYGYISYVRGKSIDYSPSSIERMLMVKRTSSTRSYEERMKQQDPAFDEILNEICVLHMQWIKDKDGIPNQLRKMDLSPQARGWLEFVRRSLIPTSNTSEVTKERVVLIYSILKGENVNVGEMIANNINKMLKSTSDNTRLAFPSIIQRLCDEAGVEKIIDEVLVKQDKFITAKKMAKVVAVHLLQRKQRAHAHGPHVQPQQEEEEAEEQPHFLALQPPPLHYQYQQFLKGFNWEQLQGDVHQMKRDLHHLREDVNQLKETQQQQWNQVNQNIQQLQGVLRISRSSKNNLTGERTISRRQYDINTQAKLNHLCNVVATLNPGYPIFMQGMEELSARQEEILAKHKEDERNYIRRLGFWKPKDAKEQEGSSKQDKGGSSPSKKKDKGKGPMN
ncbi:uncharacterized protein DS421_19g656920 [Arachis hypogaea]|uniref:Putative plant transposon protein domain-containing protein n=1 Tax=Arachis hypogaea TaxID=3818 RepID=A0A6B9V900_ARAHY|nr:uncharacterized protein DS421_19g656920 [Arachis hypogaea]